MSGDLLATIVASTRRIVEVRQEREPIEALRESLEQHPPRQAHQFRPALNRPDRLNALVPALNVNKQPDGTPMPIHGAGGGGAETDLIAQRNKAREAARTANPNPLMPKVAAAA